MSMNTALIIIIRTILAYILILFLTRLMGRKALSQMTFFDFVVGITLGTVTGSIALGGNYTYLTAVIVLISLALLAILTGYLQIKNFTLRKLFNSEPVVVIENGKINNQNMNKVRYTVDDLMMQLRKGNVFNIGDVEFAVLETNGQLSVLPKSQKKTVTPADLGINTNYVGLTKDLIIDGEIMHENLKDAQLDELWLKEELKKKGINRMTEVFYAGLDSQGNLYVSIKQRGTETEGKYGIE